MASRWNQQWKRAGRDEEAKSTRPALDPGSRTKYPQKVSLEILHNYL